MSGDKIIPFKLYVLGTLCLLTDSGDELPLRLSKAGWLLAYLALQPNVCATRNELVSTLWARADETSGRTSLRQVLTYLRNVFAASGVEVFYREADTLRLNTDNIAVDACELLHCRSLMDSETPEVLFRHWSRQLLSGISPREDAFASWLRDRRAHLHSHLEALAVDELERRIQSQLDPRPLAQVLLAYNPGHELACRAIMREEARRGNNALALRNYDTLCRYLQTQLDTYPSQITRDIVQAIRHGNLHIPQTPKPQSIEVEIQPSAPASAYIIVAVFPPQPIAETGDQSIYGQNYLWEACAEELRSRLAGFRSFSVLSSSVCARYCKRTDRVAALRHQCGIHYAFEGSVVRWGRGYRMHVGVVKAADETYVWRQPFEFEAGGLLDINDMIFTRMALSIDRAITQAEIDKSLHRGTQTLSAFDCWAHANQLFHRWTSDSDERAITYLRKAIECDEHYANAYTIWAGICNSRRFLRPGGNREMRAHLTEAIALASKAVKLDPQYARSRVALGLALLHKRHYDQAYQQFFTAVELNPYDADTLMASAVASAYLGGVIMPGGLSAHALIERESHPFAVTNSPITTGCIRRLCNTSLALTRRAWKPCHRQKTRW